MQLQVKSVHQAQGLEFRFGHLARHPAFNLIAELAHALIDDGLVERVVLIHDVMSFVAVPLKRPVSQLGCRGRGGRSAP